MGRKKYDPPERFCAVCGTMFITRNPAEYRFRRRDMRKDSPTRGKILWFCSDSCMRKFEENYPRKHYSRGFKG